MQTAPSFASASPRVERPISWAAWFLFVVCFGCTACGTDAEEPSPASTLGTATAFDLYGVGFGMTSDDFFAHSRKENRAGRMRNGEGMQVRVDLPRGEFSGPAYLEFFPRFTDQYISVIPARIGLDDWSVFDAGKHPRHSAHAAMMLLDSLNPGAAFDSVATARGTTYYRCDRDYQTVIETTDTRFLHVTFTLIDVLPDDCLCCE